MIGLVVKQVRSPTNALNNALAVYFRRTPRDSLYIRAHWLRVFNSCETTHNNVRKWTCLGRTPASGGLQREYQQLSSC
jgi:hypothetical protein